MPHGYSSKVFFKSDLTSNWLPSAVRDLKCNRENVISISFGNSFGLGTKITGLSLNVQQSLGGV